MRTLIIALLSIIQIPLLAQPQQSDDSSMHAPKGVAQLQYHWLGKKETTASKKRILTLGADVRQQYFFVKNENWGYEPLDNDGYTLTRILYHTGLSFNKQFRFFFQLQSSLSNSRLNSSPVEDNPLEIHQVYADWNLDTNTYKKITFRIGRQELQYGSQRLVSVREGPNNRQSFDAIKLLLKGRNKEADFFYSNYVVAQKGVFDDKAFNSNNRFYGAYFVFHKIPLIQNADIYYLGQRRRMAVFDDGQGPENRSSFGIRIWDSASNWQYDVESVYQFGRFSGKSISAWTASLNLSYTFQHTTLKPQLGFKTEMISGDRNYGDNMLQTFNPLYPRGAYFGLAALIGPANIIDIHPYTNINLNENCQVQLDYDAFWRFSKKDGLYAPNVALIYSGNGIEKMSIGSQLTACFVYKPTPMVYVRPEFTWFNASAFLKEAGTGKDIYFGGITVQFKIAQQH